MDLSSVDIGVLLSELEEKRLALHLSYQSDADACGVSQTTIMRIFKRKVEPSAAMLQKIASAVKYESSPLGAHSARLLAGGIYQIPAGASGSGAANPRTPGSSAGGAL